MLYRQHSRRKICPQHTCITTFWVKCQLRLRHSESRSEEEVHRAKLLVHDCLCLGAMMHRNLIFGPCLLKFYRLLVRERGRVIIPCQEQMRSLSFMPEPFSWQKILASMAWNELLNFLLVHLVIRLGIDTVLPRLQRPPRLARPPE